MMVFFKQVPDARVNAMIDALDSRFVKVERSQQNIIFSLRRKCSGTHNCGVFRETVRLAWGEHIPQLATVLVHQY